MKGRESLILLDCGLLQGRVYLCQGLTQKRHPINSEQLDKQMDGYTGRWTNGRHAGMQEVLNKQLLLSVLGEG